MKSSVGHSKRRSGIWGTLAVLCLLLCSCRTPSPAAAARPLRTEEIDLIALTSATMKTFEADDRSAFIWWLPPQLLHTLINRLQGSGTPSEAQQNTLEDFLDAANEYVLVAAGGSVHKPEQPAGPVPRRAIQLQLLLVDADGTQYRPIPENQLSATARQVIAMISLALAGEHPQFGGQVLIFAFPVRSPQGETLVNSLKKGQFQIQLGDFEGRWHLPLGALFTPRQCPTCNRVFPGDFNFCPIDQVPLENRSPLNRSK